MTDAIVSQEVLRLEARIGEPIETPADIALAEACLEEAWEWVRLHGNPEWGYLEPGTPGIARTTALAAASRCFQNPSGFVSERGDSVTFQRHDDFAQGAQLTQQEIAGLRRAGRQGGRVTSIPLVNPDMFRPRSYGLNSAATAYQVGVGDPDREPVTIYAPRWW